ncbi:hypothetical protein [Nonomuraea gerenzanensis]|uniref:Uncharacterized protein n=1 Tax=Nonomuraea gerenzanensis TaxID=93944 RepID=A0A1M4EMP2_9ACTN|nr:hypothetical protein [Nonomuraea gerenzanensis]UBU11616.1 hypothetical protein LCN96_46140 [Nonomuraea gerenzanensis]SBP00110.1 hypothetical protein BN4615_P9626 [Nonomuraea gerenzanensis]
MHTRTWPTREEWAAGAEDAVRTQCYPWQRVPESVEHYLTPAEVAERDQFDRDLSAATRPVVATEIKRLKATLPSARPTKVMEAFHWYEALDPQGQETEQRIQILERVRTALYHRARGIAADDRESVFSVPDMVTNQTELKRLDALNTKHSRLRDKAIEQALHEAIAREVAHRNSDEGWAAELERRARIDAYLTNGPIVHVR